MKTRKTAYLRAQVSIMSSFGISVRETWKLPQSSDLWVDERIRSDSSQLFFKCYYYFASAVFVVHCISMGNRQLKIKE